VHGLRQALESSLVSSLPSSEVTQYNEDVLPLLAPIRSIAGTAGSNRNSVAVSTLRVDIGPATETVARS
jgi:hypothetical protein